MGKKSKSNKSDSLMKDIQTIMHKLNKVGSVDNLDDSDLRKFEEILDTQSYEYGMNHDLNLLLSDKVYDEIAAVVYRKNYDIREDEEWNSENTKYPLLRKSRLTLHRLSDNNNDCSSEYEYGLDELVNNYLKELVGDEIYNAKVFTSPKYIGVEVLCEYNNRGKLEKCITKGDLRVDTCVDILPAALKIPDISSGMYNDREHGLTAIITVRESVMYDYNDSHDTNYQDPYKFVVDAIHESIYGNDEKILLVSAIHQRYMFLDENTTYVSPMCMYYRHMEFDITDGEKIWAFARRKNSYGDYPTNGVIMRITNRELRDRLGSYDKILRYEFNYTIVVDEKISKVKGCAVTIGEGGETIPVITVQKIQLRDEGVKRVIAPYKVIENNLLKVGDEVRVKYGTHPVLDMSYIDMNKRHKHGITLPGRCPYCRYPLSTSIVTNRYVCNNEKCRAIRRNKIYDYVVKMNIPYITFWDVKDLFENRIISHIEDLYTLDLCDTEKIVPILHGGDRVDSIIRAAKSVREVSEATFLGSLGIKGFGYNKFKDLLLQGSYNEIIELGLERNWKPIVTYRGIDRKLAINLVNGIFENRKTITEVEKYLDLIPDTSYTENATMKVSFYRCDNEYLRLWLEDNRIGVTNSPSTSNAFIIVPNIEGCKFKATHPKLENIPLVSIGRNGENVIKYIQTNYKKITE